MFSLVVQLEVRPEGREEFLTAMAANAEASVRDEPGCLRFDVCAVEGDPHRFVLYEIYADDGAFEAHRAAPHFAVWREAAGRVVATQVSTRATVVASHSAEAAA